ncbi:MAG: hydantoinase B/oxoprolinase family protein, partial [Candidatus Binatia bacterium]
MGICLSGRRRVGRHRWSACIHKPVRWPPARPMRGPMSNPQVIELFELQVQVRHGLPHHPGVRPVLRRHAHRRLHDHQAGVLQQQGRCRFPRCVRTCWTSAGRPSAGASASTPGKCGRSCFRFPPIKVFEKSELRRDVWDLLRGNNRIPEITVADLEAMIGACKVGVQRIRALVDRYGVETVCEGGEYTLDYSERALRS